MSLICIIGGLGYIGSHIAIRFLENGISVLLIDRKSSPVLQTIQSRYPLVQFQACDLTDPEQLPCIFSSYSISTIIYSMRDSFSSCSMINHYRKIILYTNIIEAIEKYLTNESCPLIQLILCSNTDIYVSEKENISFVLYLKEKIFFDYLMSHKKISFSILRISTPIGCHPILYEQLRQKKYLETNPLYKTTLFVIFYTTTHSRCFAQITPLIKVRL